MFSIVILIITIAIQAITLIVIARLIRFSRTRTSWLLIAIALIIMSLSQLLEIFNYQQAVFNKDLLQIYHWMNFSISMLLIVES